MASIPPFQRGGGRGRHFATGQPLEFIENRPGKPPMKTKMARDRFSGNFKLHVRSIPRNWNESKLNNVFSKCGDVVSTYFQPHGDSRLTWGFIEYRTYKEANYAIKTLNGNIVMDGIMASFAKEKVDANEYYGVDDGLLDDYEPPENNDSPNLPTRSSSRESTIESAKMIKTIKNDKALSTNLACERIVLKIPDHQLLKQMEDLILQRVIHLNMRIKASGHCQVCQNPSSHVCGDCKTFYCSEQCQDKDWRNHVDNCKPVKQGSERGSNTDLRAGGDSRLSNGHLVHAEGTRESRNSNNRIEETPKYDRSPNPFSGRGTCYDDKKDNTRNFNRDDQYRGDRGGGRHSENEKQRNTYEGRKTRLISRPQSEVENTMDKKPYQNQSNSNRHSFQNDRNSFSPNTSRSSFTPKPSASPTASYGQPSKSPAQSISPGEEFLSKEKEFSSKPDVSKPEHEVTKPSTSSKINISTRNPQTSLLSMGNVEQVDITSVEAVGVFNVMPRKVLPAFAALMKGISHEDGPFPRFTPVKDGICAAKFSGTWCRCQVVNLNPLTVKYLDFGNFEEITPEKLATIPPELAAQSPYAVKVKLADGTPSMFMNLPESDSLSIKPTQLLGDCWLCEVVADEPDKAQAAPPPQTPASSTTQVPQQVQNLAMSPHHLLPPGCFTKVFVRSRGDTTLGVSPLANEDLKQLTERLQAESFIASPLDSPPPLKAKCMAKSSKDNLWYRGIVKVQDPVTVYFVDKGNLEVCSHTNLRVLPVALEKIKPQASTIKGKVGLSNPIFQNDIFAVKRVDKDEDGWVVEVAEVPKVETPQATQPVQATPSTNQSCQLLSPQSTTQPKSSPSQQTSSLVTVPSSRPKPIFPNFLPPDEFTTVLISLPEPAENCLGDTYYVGLQNLFDNIVEMATYFKDCAPHCDQLTPQHGALGISLFEGLYYRVKVIDLSPLRVQYIDYGNIEEIQAEKLKKCPDTHKDIPRLVHKIKLAAGTHSKYFNLPAESLLSVKPVSLIPEGAVVVQVEGETYNETSLTDEAPETSPKSQQVDLATSNEITPVTDIVTENPVLAETEVLTGTPGQSSPTLEHSTTSEDIQKQNSISDIPKPRRCQNPVELLEESCSFTFIPIDLVDNKIIGAIHSSVLPESVILSPNSNDVMENQPYDPNFKPSVGELVACQLSRDKSWCRGKLLGEDNLCALVDVGDVQSCSQIKRLPDSLASFPPQAVVLSIHTTHLALADKIVKQDFLQFTVSSVTGSDGERIVEVESQVEDASFTGFVSGWKYEPLATAIPLKSGDHVTICKVVSSNSFMVAPVDNLNLTQQKIQIECRKLAGEVLTSPPKEGDYVAFLHPSEDVFYRSQVKKVDSVKNEFTLYNIDLGTQDVGNQANLHPLPKSLSQIPCLAQKVVLKGVDERELTEQFQVFISDIVKKEKLLTVEVNEHEIEVSLIIAEDNDKINDKLQLLIQPQVLLDLNGKLTMQALPKQVVRFGEELMVSVVQTEPLFLALAEDTKKFFYESHSVNNDIQLYCAVETAPYNPCQGELCLVKFENEWHRAECLRETNQGFSVVSLIDFGNITSFITSDIRKMKPEFLVAPPLAFGCRVSGLPAEISSELKSRLEQLLEVYTVHTAVFESFTDNYYNVNMPFLISTLQREGLI